MACTNVCFLPAWDKYHKRAGLDLLQLGDAKGARQWRRFIAITCLGIPTPTDLLIDRPQRLGNRSRTEPVQLVPKAMLQ